MKGFASAKAVDRIAFLGSSREMTILIAWAAEVHIISGARAGPLTLSN